MSKRRLFPALKVYKCLILIVSDFDIRISDFRGGAAGQNSAFTEIFA